MMENYTNRSTSKTYPLHQTIQFGCVMMLAFMFLTMIFAVAANDARANHSVEHTIEINKAHDRYKESVVQYCDYRVAVGLTIHQAREDGKPLSEVIESLRNYYNISKEGRIPHHFYIEFENMARIIYRNEDRDLDYFADRFHTTCLRAGF